MNQPEQTTPVPTQEAQQEVYELSGGSFYAACKYVGSLPIKKVITLRKGLWALQEEQGCADPANLPAKVTISKANMQVLLSFLQDCPCDEVFNVLLGLETDMSAYEQAKAKEMAAAQAKAAEMVVQEVAQTTNVAEDGKPATAYEPAVQVPASTPEVLDIGSGDFSIISWLDLYDNYNYAYGIDATGKPLFKFGRVGGVLVFSFHGDDKLITTDFKVEPENYHMVIKRVDGLLEIWLNAELAYSIQSLDKLRFQDPTSLGGIPLFEGSWFAGMTLPWRLSVGTPTQLQIAAIYAAEAPYAPNAPAPAFEGLTKAPIDNGELNTGDSIATL